jgi:hypothetical protein
MKAYIISHNRLALTVNMANWLADFAEPVIVDNDSDYPPLLEYYETCPYIIIRLSTNLGSGAPWEAGIVDDYSSGESYLVTDPDLDMTGVPNDWLEELQIGLDRHPSVTKAGIGLRLDDLPDTEIAKQAKEWEAPHWAYPLDDGRFYKASTATTLCLCRTSEHVFPSVRTSAPYLARHIPWYYTDIEDLPEDEIYYMKTVYGKKWNYWASRIADELGV